MKKNIINIGISLIVIFILSLCFSNSSNAAIEIKPGTEVHTNNTANTEFMYCYNMRNSTSSLANNTLDPHMALNTDWGAVAYLGASAYGDLRNGTGDYIVIEGKSYYSLTNNKTGVMDMGRGKYTRTAGIMDGSIELKDNNYTSILYNFKNTRYVDKITSEHKTLGMAYLETKWFGANNTVNVTSGQDKNVTARKMNNIFDGDFSTTNGASSGGNGMKYTSVTYRPVIWN